MRQVNKWKANGIEWPGGQSLEMGDLSLPLGCVITDKKNNYLLGSTCNLSDRLHNVHVSYQGPQFYKMMTINPNLQLRNQTQSLLGMCAKFYMNHFLGCSSNPGMYLTLKLVLACCSWSVNR